MKNCDLANHQRRAVPSVLEPWLTQESPRIGRVNEVRQVRPKGDFVLCPPVDGQWVVRTYGPFYWVFVSSSMIYIFVSIWYITKALKKTLEKDLRRQIQLCLIGVVLAVLFSILDLLVNVVLYPVFGLVPGLISMGIFISAICFVTAIQRYDLFNIISVARHEVLNSMATAMVVLDKSNVVLDSNYSASRYLKVKPGDAFDIGGVIINSDPHNSENILDVPNIYHDSNTVEKEIIIQGEKKVNALINISPVLDCRNKLLGRVVTFNDVTRLRSLVDEVHEKNTILCHQNNELLKIQNELHEANKKLSEMAIVDDLTGCYNKRFLFEHLINEINAAQRYKHSFTIMVLDLDEFKKVNDTYGHLAGDDVLRDVAKLVKNNLRQSDIISRFGGEEFIIYSPSCDNSKGVSLARKIKDVVKGYPFYTNGCCLQVTVSIGLACYFPGEGETGLAEELLNSLLRRADDALYRAKGLGRNRIVVADE